MPKKSGNTHFHAILRGCLKKKNLNFSGAWDCLLCGVPYIYIIITMTDDYVYYVCVMISLTDDKEFLRQYLKLMTL